MKSGLKNTVAFVLIAFLLSACSSVRIFTLEVLEPAPITIPSKFENVIILNNTVVQPSSQSVFLQYQKEAIEDFPLDFDTATWVAIYSAADVLTESGFFENVDIYTKPTRKDNDLLSQKVLEKSVLDDFFLDMDYDAIISVDRMIFSVNQVTKPIDKSESKKLKRTIINNATYGLISCGVYTKDRPTPLTQFSVTDSLIFNSYFEGDSIGIFKTFPESIIRALSVSLAENVANKFIPTWSQVKRLLYNSEESRMREAHSYASSGDWDSALSIWSSLMEETEKPLKKAKLSSNVAVAFEMKDLFEAAKAWAIQSEKYFKKNGSPDSSEDMQWIQSYILSLDNRISNNKLLDIQWGVASETNK